MAEALLIGGFVLGAAGLGVQVNAAYSAQNAQEHVIRSQQNAEAIRYNSMQIDANRRRREAIRQSIIQRATANAAANSQGAQYGSALPGAYGQIAGTTNQGFNNIGLQESLGNQMFANNLDMLQGRREEAAAGTQAAIGQGLGSLGGRAMSAAQPFGRLAQGFPLV